MLGCWGKLVFLFPTRQIYRSLPTPAGHLAYCLRHRDALDHLAEIGGYPLFETESLTITINTEPRASWPPGILTSQATPNFLPPGPHPLIPLGHAPETRSRRVYITPY